MSSEYVTFREIQIRNEMQTPEVLRAMRNKSFDVQVLQNEQNPLAVLYRDTYKYLEYPGYSTVQEREIVRDSINNGKEISKMIIQNMIKPYAPNIHA
jgi:hypothetical protein